MGGALESTATTTNAPAPSPYDKEKANTLQQLTNLITPYLIPELAGGMTAGKQKAFSGQTAQAMQGAGKMGVAKGSPNLASALAPSLGGNNDVMNYALQLYGMQPSGSSGKGSSTTSESPGALDYVNSAAQMAMIAKAMGAFGGGGGGEGMTNTGSGYSYNMNQQQPLPAGMYNFGPSSF
jgi:hypothetical protein